MVGISKIPFRHRDIPAPFIHITEMAGKTIIPPRAVGDLADNEKVHMHPRLLYERDVYFKKLKILVIHKGLKRAWVPCHTEEATCHTRHGSDLPWAWEMGTAFPPHQILGMLIYRLVPCRVPTSPTPGLDGAGGLSLSASFL